MLRQPLDTIKIERQNITLREKVLTTLRKAILNFQLLPGDRLVERDLCELLGVSRTSVREALRHLESEGLVEYLANKGPIVAKITLEDAKEIYEVRASLESLIVQLYCINASDKQIAQLEAMLNLLTRRLSDSDLPNIVESVNDFYNLLFEGCGNRTAAQSLKQLQARINLLRATSVSQKDRYQASIEEMNAIVKAIKERDLVAAHQACIIHVKNASEVALKAMAEKEGQPVPSIFEAISDLR
ncbi:GntR family transcriptional regulator [Zobellella maritima]|uniref:GntR family transcriptional regulator n=1 Tax=Zobellella maritima TaxID=2059725 RepID=UPI000E300D0A|nr:GntR family transcriptional regulator [Zobellella maritima]